MCVGGCERLCTCLCVPFSVRICMWKPQVDVGCLSHSLTTLFLIQALSLRLELINMLSQADEQSERKTREMGSRGAEQAEHQGHLLKIRKWCCILALERRSWEGRELKGRPRLRSKTTSPWKQSTKPDPEILRIGPEVAWERLVRQELKQSRREGWQN